MLNNDDLTKTGLSHMLRAFSRVLDMVVKKEVFWKLKEMVFNQLLKLTEYRYYFSAGDVSVANASKKREAAVICSNKGAIVQDFWLMHHSII